MRQRQSSFPLLVIPQEDQVTQPIYKHTYMYTHTYMDLAQTLIVVWVSVGPYETWLVDSVGRVLEVSLAPLAPTILPPPFFGVPRAPLNAWPWVSASVPISFSMEPLWWWLCWALVYEHSKLSLGMVGGFLASHVWFYPGSLGCSASGCWTCRQQAPHPSLGVFTRATPVGCKEFPLHWACTLPLNTSQFQLSLLVVSPQHLIPPAPIPTCP